MRTLFLPAVLLAVLLSAGCRKQPDPVVATALPGAGLLSLEVTNQMNGAALLPDHWYVTAPGDSVQLTTYRYYISNISLTTITGETYTEPESYHLIDQAKPESRKITLSNVPAGSYTSVHFLIGVDSLHNTSGAQAGDLAPNLGMIWTWNTGYIMAKMEGFSPQSPNSDHRFFYHVAGFKAPNSVLRWVTLPFPSTAVVAENKIPNVHLMADMGKWFDGPSKISMATTHDVMTEGRDALNLANNYQYMFRADHVDQ